jgi:branched-chain amino acid transport system substrate-binding protein
MDRETPQYKKFIEAYGKIADVEPGAYSAYAYDAAYVFLSAVKKAGTLDPAKVKAAMMETDLRGASKEIKFRENGDSGSSYIVFKVKDGDFMNYYDPATGKKF